MKVYLSRLLAVLFLLAGAGLTLPFGHTHTTAAVPVVHGDDGDDGDVPPHIGSPVVFIRYESPQVIGTERAALIVAGPFECPADGLVGGHGPDAREPILLVERAALPKHIECANIEFFTLDRGWRLGTGDPENADPVMDENGPTGAFVYTGMDWRMNVVHDPSGQAPRSWRLYGEAADDVRVGK